MADDGEIDIEGEFDFKLEVGDGFYDVNELPSKSVNLLPEYTNPPWMLEQGWTLDMDEKSKATIEKMLLEEQQYLNGKTRSKQSSYIEKVVKKSTPPKVKPLPQKIPLPSVSNKPSKNKRHKGMWNMEEKAMFLKGLEVFGRSWTKISDLIPSRTTLQVKNYAQQYFKNLLKQKESSDGESKNESYSPSNGFQTVLESVETGQPTIKTFKTSNRNHRLSSTNQTKSSQNQSFTNITEKSGSKTENLSVNILQPSTSSEPAPTAFIPDNPNLDSSVMFKTELPSNLLSSMLVNNHSIPHPDNSKDLKSSTPSIFTEHNYPVIEGQNMDKADTNSDLKESSDSDEIDIDIENDDTENSVLLERSTSPTSVYEKLLQSAKVNLHHAIDSDEDQSDKDEIESEPQEHVHNEKKDNESPAEVKSDDISNCSSDQQSIPESEDSVENKIRVQKTLVNGVVTSGGDLIEFPIPTTPVSLNFDEISEEEQTIHSEFFDGRPSKTPDRYLKIRNHIIETWLKCKPSYLNKTSVRRGLKNCGDVNCIGRIHAYLECTGVINFGCEQAVYNNLSRPQFITVKNEVSSPVQYVTDKYDLVSRCRKRRIRDSMGDWVDIKDYEGKTIEHKVLTDEDIKPKVVKVVKTSYDPFKLVPCQQFTSDKKAPFDVEINNLALIVMDVHAHISKTEVIGMLGGRYNTDCGKLEIIMAVPCTSLSTGMQCEMDPVSQTLASEEICDKGLKVVGWYHSHPTFSPNPSIRDIETQIKFQEWFSKLGGCNFIGIIVSPYNRSNISNLSEVTCLTISQDICPQLHCNIPHEFDYKVVYSEWNEDTVKCIKYLASQYLVNYNHIKLSAIYKQSTGITCLQKMLESIKQYIIKDDNHSQEILQITKKFFGESEEQLNSTQSQIIYGSETSHNENNIMLNSLDTGQYTLPDQTYK